MLAGQQARHRERDTSRLDHARDDEQGGLAPGPVLGAERHERPDQRRVEGIVPTARDLVLDVLLGEPHVEHGHHDARQVGEAERSGTADDEGYWSMWDGASDRLYSATDDDCRSGSLRASPPKSGRDLNSFISNKLSKFDNMQHAQTW